MQQLNRGNTLIPIDENMTLQDIMGTDSNSNSNLGKLYDQMADSIKNLNVNEKKKKKSKAKAKANLPAVPITAQTPAKVQAKAAANDKEAIIMKILKYQSSRRFGAYITKELKITQSRQQLLKLSIDRLNNILHRIRLNLNNRNLDAIFENMAITCAKGYETTITHFGFDIEGFTDLLTANPGFWDAFERWKIERELPDIPPGIQLGYIVATTTLAAHTLNTGKALKPSDKNESRSDANEKKQEDVIILDKDEAFEVGKTM